MLYNYLKISIRNILRHKLFSFITIIGLVLSISYCLAALMIFKNQYNFDKFHPHPERTYRVITQITPEIGSTLQRATAPLQVADIIREEYDFVETTTRVYSAINYTRVTSNGKTLRVDWGAFTEPSFFDVFGFKLASGNPESALQEPWSVILTPETAGRFFEDRDPVGERFSIEGIGDFTITGVLEPVEESSHLKFGMLASFSTIPLLPEDSQYNAALTQWSDLSSGVSANTYVLTDPGVPRRTLETALASLGQRIEDTYPLDNSITNYNFGVQTLNEITPSRGIRGAGDAGRGILDLIIIIGGIPLVILLMACFNYTNLSIARALKRAKEVGVYKVMGASRLQVFTQFTLEATLVVLVALILAYVILPLIPLPEEFMEEVLSVNLDAELVGWFLLFALFTGLLAGGLPALLISSVQPAKVLRNFKDLQLIKGFTIRKGLVVIQFAISLVLIIWTYVWSQQYQYLATSDYGFRTENMLEVSLQGIDQQLLRDEIVRIEGVERISSTSSSIASIGRRVNLKREQLDPSIRSTFHSVDHNLISNMELTLLAGSNFPQNLSGGDQGPIIVNEQVVSMLGWENPGEALGESVWLRDSLQVSIVGILQDFQYESNKDPIRPLVLQLNPDASLYLNVKIAASSNIDAIEDRLAAVLERMAPGYPIEYYYLDQYINDRYTENPEVLYLGFYGLVAFIIAGLGLLGMVTYTVEVRTREVGIRKVLGAGVHRIIALLSREFIWLLTFAALIGIPTGYMIGEYSLSEVFAYRISIGFGTFAISLGIMLLIGLLAIGTQTWKIAKENPVEALRSE